MSTVEVWRTIGVAHLATRAPPLQRIGRRFRDQVDSIRERRTELDRTFYQITGGKAAPLTAQLRAIHKIYVPAYAEISILTFRGRFSISGIGFPDAAFVEFQIGTSAVAASNVAQGNGVVLDQMTEQHMEITIVAGERGSYQDLKISLAASADDASEVGTTITTFGSMHAVHWGAP